MSLRACLLVLGLLLSALSAAADDYTKVPEPFVYCTTCHGVELKGNLAVDAPRLNGMAEWYVVAQLRAFKQEWRGTHPEDLVGMEMQPQAAVLADADLDKAARFIASVPTRTTAIEQTVTGDVERGQHLYPTCAACHGTEAQGSEVLGAPALAGQSDWYLVRQLEKYAAGARGYAAADARGQQMRAAVSVLTGANDITDVVAYVNTLPAR